MQPPTQQQPVFFAIDEDNVQNEGGSNNGDLLDDPYADDDRQETEPNNGPTPFQNPFEKNENKQKNSDPTEHSMSQLDHEEVKNEVMVSPRIMGQKS